MTTVHHETVPIADRLLLSPGQAAELCGINYDWAYRMARDGTWRAFREGRRWLIARQAVEAWIAQRLAEAESA